MDAFQNLFLRKLRERIDLEISELSRHLIDGKAKDHADYRGKVEFIRALRLVGNEYCEQVRAEIEGEDRSPKRPALTSQPKWSP
jgi:hypothetical protein